MDPVFEEVDDPIAHAEENVQVVQEVIAYLKEHAEELRKKGLPIDEMVRDLERKVAEVLAAAKKVRELRAEDEHMTREREQLRRDVDGLTANLPGHLVDGMSTIEYLNEAARRERDRQKRGQKGMGG